MSISSDEQLLLPFVRRYLWLLSELHGGNEFSRDQLWRWLEEAQAAIHKVSGA